MRTLTAIFFASALGMFGHASAARAAVINGAIDECGGYSQADMRTCLVRKLRESETALHQAETETLATLSKWDEDTKYVSVSKTHLQAASLAFLQYRTAQCAFISSLGGGAIASAVETRRLACAIDLNRTQADLYVRGTATLTTR